MRSLSNLECVGETLRAALDELASLVPEWLIQQIGADAPALGKELKRVHMLRHVWQQYDDLSEGQATWRTGPTKKAERGSPSV